MTNTWKRKIKKTEGGKMAIRKVMSCSLFVLLLFTGMVHGAIPAGERSALIALYNAANGDSWNNNSNWKGINPEPDGFSQIGTEGTWYGVTVENDHVTKIILLYNNLVGSIPSQLGNLTGLDNLNLKNNQLSGTIPAELGNLNSLENFYLNTNQLSGAIPGELGNLTPLKILYLNNNYLDGPIPTNLTNLTNLYATGLDIGTNCLCATDASLISWLNTADPDWAANQSQCAASLITVTSPNGSENWTEGDNHNIAWTSQANICGVKIEYSVDNGSTWNTVIASTANDGSYTWTVPGDPSTTCKVRISDAADGSPTDQSDAVFTINTAATPGITVNTPNGGEELEVNSTYYIGWSSIGFTGNVKIEYTTDNSTTWTTMISSTDNDGSYSWTVPNAPSTTCKVRISDAADGTPADESDSVFTIKLPPTNKIITVLSPNGGENCTVGSSYNIAWAATGISNNVKIDYSTTAGPPWITIIPSTTNNGTYPWTVPNTPDSNCKVRISDAADPTATDTSDSVFSIVSGATTPTVTTENISSITSNSASCAGNVTSDGGAAVTARGACWSTSTNPTISNSKTVGGTGTGSFTANLTGLTPNTTYYVRAYATNSIGTSYGAEKSFTTPSTPPPPPPITYNLYVSSTPSTGVSITVSPADNNSNGNGETEFTRIYNTGTTVTLTAPAEHDGKNFSQWLIDEEPNENQTITITMNSNHTVRAVYDTTTYTLSVQSFPDTGINITVNPADIDNNGNGATDFTRTYNPGTSVTLTAPAAHNGKNFSRWTVDGNDYNDNTIQVTMQDNQTAVVCYETPEPPEIGIRGTKLNLGYIVGSGVQPGETFTVFNSGGGTLNWTVSTDESGLELEPTSGQNCGVVRLNFNAAGLSPGEYTYTIKISSPDAANSPVEIEVNLWVKSQAQASHPFGEFATPTGDSAVRGSIPVTGWVLSDTGMESVKIYRQEGNNLIYIGDATFVEGARPDIEAAYPDYPMNDKAGWGYMMLTNFLPNNGNGTFKIYAIATDREGKDFRLGIKTIIVDNANAVKPFGALDTPGQGGTVSGSRFINWGWVLTPQPNYIPEDGSTINVYVNGVNLGHPFYNIYRADIAGLFPGYANSGGAVGYFYLDTTAYEDGVHTIQWTASDSAGNKDGIGSRYFTINNACSTARNANIAGNSTVFLPFPSHVEIPFNYSNPVRTKKGYECDTWTGYIYPDEKGQVNLETRELEPIVIHLDAMGFTNNNNGPGKTFEPQFPHPSRFHGFLVAGKDQLKPLPIGATLDKKTGIFYWLPGPGFSGNYRLMFIKTGPAEEPGRIDIMVNIGPKFTKE
jgi:hypothetical protein